MEHAITTDGIHGTFLNIMGYRTSISPLRNPKSIGKTGDGNWTTVPGKNSAGLPVGLFRAA